MNGEQVTSSPETPPGFAIVRRDSVGVFFSRADQPEVRTRPIDGAPNAYALSDLYQPEAQGPGPMHPSSANHMNQ